MTYDTVYYKKSPVLYAPHCHLTQPYWGIALGYAKYGSETRSFPYAVPHS